LWFDEKGNGFPVEKLDFETESQKLFDSLKEANKAIEVRVEAASTDYLRTLVTLGCRALHFTGHGNPDFLAFEDGKGGTQPIDAEILKELFEAGHTRNVQLVFVSACFSARAGEAFAAAGVPHVVAVRLDTSVYDDSARTFARAFYLALFTGDTVKQAFDIGREAVGSAPGIPSAGEEKEKFLLLPEKTNHDVSIFDDIPTGSFKDVSRMRPRSNLPSIPEDFVGRARDQWQVINLVLQRRLVTIRGAPGIGKSALAIAVGAYLNERSVFSDGVFFIRLRGVTSSEAIRFAIAGAFGITANNDEELIQFTTKHNCLLVMDNCEDILRVNANQFRSFLSELLQNSRHIKVLLTSRESLGGGLQGLSEQIYVLHQLEPLDAARLFIALARPLTPSEFGVSHIDQIPETLAKHPILGFLSGHPQAISLAAPLLEEQSVSQLQHLLQTQRADALVIKSVPENERDALTSLVISLNASFNHIRATSQDSARLFTVMGLLPSGVFSEDLEKIWGDTWRGAMDNLVRASLVERLELPTTEHFSTLPFVTTFAEDLLSPYDRKRFAIRISIFFAEMIQNLYQSLVTENATRAKTLFSFEESNFWACLDLRRPALSRGSSLASRTAVVATYLTPFLVFSGRPHDGIRAAELGRTACRALGDTNGEASVMHGLADLKKHIGDYRGALQDCEASLLLFKKSGYKLGEANALALLGELKYSMKQLRESKNDLELALSLFKREKATHGEAGVLLDLARLKRAIDDVDGAMKDCKSAIELSRTEGDALAEANCLFQMGLMKGFNNHEGAREDFERALELYEKIDLQPGEANVHRELGELDISDGKPDEGLRHLSQAVRIRIQCNEFSMLGDDLDALAHGYASENGQQTAILLLEEACLLNRVIQDRDGEAQDLLNQGLSFLQENMPMEGLAAIFNAKEIWQDLQDSNPEKETNDLLKQVQSTLGNTEYEKIVTAIEGKAEDVRLEGVASVRASTKLDPIAEEILGKTRGFVESLKSRTSASGVPFYQSFGRSIVLTGFRALQNK